MSKLASKNLNFLCLASFYKGNDFLVALKKEGHTVFLLTSKKLQCEDWPWEYIDDVFYIQEDEVDNWNYDHMIEGTAFLMRSTKIDRIVALDDFDVEKAALLRETFRISGMGQSTARKFRDKLAMRVAAQNHSIKVPAFTALFNDQEIDNYLNEVQAPWMIKPRGEASAVGIEKCYTKEQVWDILDRLGSKRFNYLIEQFRPGDVYHVDSITFDGKVKFTQVSRYLSTPHTVAHGGGIFRTVTEPYESENTKKLAKLNEEVIKTFGMQYSATHTEFIRCLDDNQFYFLETSSRVGGAHIAEMVEAATGINLWAEWAKVESAAALDKPYKSLDRKNEYSGLIISLSKFEKPHYGEFYSDLIKWTLEKPYHLGMIVASTDKDDVMKMVNSFTQIIQEKYHAQVSMNLKPLHNS